VNQLEVVEGQRVRPRPLRLGGRRDPDLGGEIANLRNDYVEGIGSRLSIAFEKVAAIPVCGFGKGDSIPTPYFG
jgi:hypothetical protein